MKGTDVLDNAAIAELSAHEAEQVSGQLRQAFRRAAGIHGVRSCRRRTRGI